MGEHGDTGQCQSCQTIGRLWMRYGRYVCGSDRCTGWAADNPDPASTWYDGRGGIRSTPPDPSRPTWRRLDQRILPLGEQSPYCNAILPLTGGVSEAEGRLAEEVATTVANTQPTRDPRGAARVQVAVTIGTDMTMWNLDAMDARDVARLSKVLAALGPGPRRRQGRAGERVPGG